MAHDEGEEEATITFTNRAPGTPAPTLPVPGLLVLLGALLLAGVALRPSR